MIPKYTLLELNKSIQDNIKTNFPTSIWVIAEISELKVNRNGHCYIELIEKDIIDDTIIAKSRATIWAYTFRMVKPYFESTTGHELSTGIKILVQANVEFHEIYGFSLNITDIDPNYTIGELAQKRTETIKKLEEEGVLNMNKEIPFPIVPQKIAIISSNTAAGYQDFVDQLENNAFGFKYYTKLFQSTMQGKEAEDSIINSLEEIYNYEDFFDIVVIIRGGGSQADLYCFNNYLLASNVAQFPLPIITGIGHDKDESVVDIVAHQKLKTPTAVAEFIVEKSSEFENRLNDLRDTIVEIINHDIQDKNALLIQYRSLVRPIILRNIDRYNYHLKTIKEQTINQTTQILNNKSSLLVKYTDLLEKKINRNIHTRNKTLSTIEAQLKSYCMLLLQKEKHSQENLKTRIELLDPERILKRGYSITYHNGKRLINSKNITIDDEIITKLYSGIIRSKISK